MSKIVLLCTVGGSPQPVVTAIRETRPDFVQFFCTKDDGGGPGSIGQVKGEDACVPEQAELARDRFDACVVPADDFDGGFLRVREAIEELRGRYPGARLVADYTGGTKTMATALFVAAMEAGGVELQLVTGVRKDLKTVKDGTQGAFGASVGRVRTDRAIRFHMAAWRHYGYHEAAEGLATVRLAADSPDLARLRSARSLSRAFARWDKFDHAGALDLIVDHGSQVADTWPWMMPTLRLLAGDAARDEAKREPARLFDLWLNAQRRAAQGRYDDAVARWYRLVEWTAQWQLRTKLDADTADFPRDRLPSEVDAEPDSDGKIKLGLRQAWQVAGCRLPEPVPAFVARSEGELRNLLGVRNHSILAHGFRPVGEAEWDRIRAWTADRFLPLLRGLANEAHLRSPPSQLPSAAPKIILTSP